MMKWEDITDEARKATEQALTDLLTENRKISGDQLSIRLQDPAYLEKKSIRYKIIAIIQSTLISRINLLKETKEL